MCENFLLVLQLQIELKTAVRMEWKREGKLYKVSETRERWEL